MKCQHLFAMFEVFLLHQGSKDPHSLETKSTNSLTRAVRVRVKFAVFRTKAKQLYLIFLLASFSLSLPSGILADILIVYLIYRIH